jgi:hypothetical protein
MSDRRRPDQLELFPLAPTARSAGSIDGLEVILDRPCSRCGERVALIVTGRGPHSAGAECARCGHFRQWLARECRSSEVQADLFGEPIAVSPFLVRLERAIDQKKRCCCCGNLAFVHAGHGPHAAKLKCAACGAHRGWLPKAALAFLLETACLFGAPNDR